MMNYFDSMKSLFEKEFYMTKEQYDECCEWMDLHKDRSREDIEYTTLSDVITLRFGIKGQYYKNKKIQRVQMDSRNGQPTTSDWGISEKNEHDFVPIVFVMVHEDYPVEYQDREEYEKNRVLNQDLPEGKRHSFYVFFRTNAPSHQYPSDTNGKEMFRTTHQSLHPSFEPSILYKDETTGLQLQQFIQRIPSSNSSSSSGSNSNLPPPLSLQSLTVTTYKRYIHTKNDLKNFFKTIVLLFKQKKYRRILLWKSKVEIFIFMSVFEMESLKGIKI